MIKAIIAHPLKHLSRFTTLKRNEMKNPKFN